VAVLELSWANKADEKSDKKTTKIGDEFFRILKAILYASGFETSLNAKNCISRTKNRCVLANTAAI